MSTATEEGPLIPSMSSVTSLLCKPVTVECNQKTTSQMDSVSSDITVGSAELVEAVFDRLTMGLYRCKDDVPTPEYCEVSGSCLVVVI